uniref:protein-serine/threonine phosphatase n=1 Tax=Petromyzon marinus TaxID=7757 RepID=S4S1S4_PETMA
YSLPQCAFSLPQPPPPPPPKTKQKKTISGRCASNASLLRARGITCVVNASLEVADARLPGVRYVRVPVPDCPHAPISRYFDPVAERIAGEARRGGRTLVHCAAGVSRSASLCIAYLMRGEGLVLRDAFRWVRARRPAVCPNSGFWRQLIRYERELFGRCSVRLVHLPAGCEAADLCGRGVQQIIRL